MTVPTEAEAKALAIGFNKVYGGVSQPYHVYLNEEKVELSPEETERLKKVKQDKFQPISGVDYELDKFFDGTENGKVSLRRWFDIIQNTTVSTILEGELDGNFIALYEVWEGGDSLRYWSVLPDGVFPNEPLDSVRALIEEGKSQGFEIKKEV